MKITRHSKSRQRGVALIIVMVVIFVLAALAGGFAYSMRVEMTLARNARYDVDMDWMARSAVETASYILGEQLRVTHEPYDALDQLWAGGEGLSMQTNEFVMDLILDWNPGDGAIIVEVDNGRGTATLRIEDAERKAGINMAGRPGMTRALEIIGIDLGDIPIIVDSYIDWMDRDDDPHLSGAESSYYLGLDPPYYAKNGPIDAVSELLLIRGVTPEIYWGSEEFRETAFERGYTMDGVDVDPGPVGLVDLFTVFHAGPINVNTATNAVLQLLPHVDQYTAASIVAERRSDFGPYASMRDLVARVPEITTELAQLWQSNGLADVRSHTFEIDIEVRIGTYTRKYLAVVRRVTFQDIRILRLHAQ